jgi:5-(carboxyamino)imidazole ribonucleotide mutase
MAIAGAAAGAGGFADVDGDVARDAGDCADAGTPSANIRRSAARFINPDGILLGRCMNTPLVGVIMGSKSDWDTMRQADEVLTEFGVAHECRIVSAHRTPAWMAEYASTAASRGLEVIIAGAGGAAHLPGMVAAQTILPVIGVPVQSAALNGLDSLLSIVQMPKGVPVATVAIGASGAANAGLLAVSILATSRPDLRAKLQSYRDAIADDVRRQTL